MRTAMKAARIWPPTRIDPITEKGDPRFSSFNPSGRANQLQARRCADALRRSCVDHGVLTETSAAEGREPQRIAAPQPFEPRR